MANVIVLEYSMPEAEDPREASPFATVFAAIDEGVQKPIAVACYLFPWFGKKVTDFFPLFLG
jgi:hypothetical protein